MKRLLVSCLLLFAPTLAAQSFDDLHQAIEQGDFGNLKALVISRHGDIIFEGYYRGTGSADLHQVHSVTKSVGASLIGIAHRQGRIRLDDDLEGFFEGLYDMTQDTGDTRRSNCRAHAFGINAGLWSPFKPTAILPHQISNRARAVRVRLPGLPGTRETTGATHENQYQVSRRGGNGGIHRIAGNGRQLQYGEQQHQPR